MTFRSGLNYQVSKLSNFIAGLIIATLAQQLTDYPAKILVAFGEAINGNDKIFNWLLKHGYPELAALSKAIRGSDDAFQWLMTNSYPHYAALDMAIVNDKKAYEWLARYKFHFLIVFADASRGKPDAIRWLAMHDLQIFIRIAKFIKAFTDNQKFDYHKLHF